MYVGRIVAVGCAEKPFAAYRVSSRSFPNRQAVKNDAGAAIIPRPGHEEDLQRNPYIAYNCLRVVGGTIVVSNGSHTDPIAEKLSLGYPPRDAMALSLLSMDFEKDQYSTPRIAGILAGERGYLGVVREDGLQVESFRLQEGLCRAIATYEMNRVTDIDYPIRGGDAETIARALVEGEFFRDLEHPVCAAAWMGEIGLFNIDA